MDGLEPIWKLCESAIIQIGRNDRILTFWRKCSTIGNILSPLLAIYEVYFVGFFVL